MKYFRLLTDTSILFSESIITQKGLDALIQALKDRGETIKIETELIDRSSMPVNDFNFYYVPTNYILGGGISEEGYFWEWVLKLKYF